jgi:hypothetical protein
VWQYIPVDVRLMLNLRLFMSYPPKASAPFPFSRLSSKKR